MENDFFLETFFRVITEKPPSKDHTQENALLSFNTCLHFSKVTADEKTAFKQHIAMT